MQFCELTVKTKAEDLNIILVYRSPNSSTENTDKLCQVVRRMRSNTILIGDINLPGINWTAGTSDQRGRGLLEAVLEEGVDQLVEFPTHIKGNILDLILTNCPQKILSVEDAGRLGNSDHEILLVEVEVAQIKEDANLIRPNWLKADIAGLRMFFHNTNWRDLLSGELDSAWTAFKQRMEEGIRLYVPNSTIKKSGGPRWLKRDVMRLLRRKKRAWKYFKLNGSAYAKAQYVELEREVKVKIRSAKRRMERDLAVVKDNGKKFSNYIKSKTKSKTGVGPLKGVDGKLLLKDSDMAQELNRFFSSTFTNEDLTTVPVLDKETQEELATLVVTRAKIRQKIRALKEDSAAGPDGIQPKLLKASENELLEPLELLFKKSIQSGKIPADWKTAVVIPIFKKGAKGEAGNYRPVSLTSVPCKLLEGLIKEAMMDHLLRNQLIRDSQHGFMTGRSCTTNLVEYLDVATRLVDQGKAADIVYLDFAKAFDKVPRERLLAKLEAKGITGAILQWIRNWLSDRTQRVKVKEALSESSEVESGVPQGTVLGPVLFIVFIDDIDEAASLLDFMNKFADDTKGLKSIENVEDCEKMQQTLDKLCSWANKWGMKFNVKKCKIMHIGPGNPGHRYRMEGEELVEVEEERDIGVVVSKNLKPSRQCQQAANTAGAVLRQVTKNFHYRDKKHFLKLYSQYVRPHLEFSVPAWSPWQRADILILERVQQKAIGMVSGLQGKTYEERLQEVGMDTLEARREHMDMAQLFKIIHGHDKVEVDKLFKRVAHTGAAVTRRAADSLNLEQPRCRLEVRQHSFAVRVIDRWNKIDSKTKRLSHVKSFKRALRTQYAGGRP